MHSLPLLPPPVSGPVDLLIIAGEHSGDQHAAKLVQGMLRQKPELKIVALGGPDLAQSGAQLLYDLTATSVVGFVEVLAHASFFRQLFLETLDWIDRHRPKAVCFIDYPGFNLRIAKALLKRRISRKGGGNVSTLFYISPQIWAWKARRRFEMAATLDALAVIFPFEIECYADTSLPVSFVGHPFVADDYAAPVSYDPEGPILLLPGSRKQAVRRIFPALRDGFLQLGSKRRALVLYPSEAIREIIGSFNPPDSIALAQTGTPIAASAVLTSSGTMSMHCALAAIPGAIVYRTNPLTFLLGKMLVKTPYIGIANLLLKLPMYPEFLQGDARADSLARELHSCLEDPKRQVETSAHAQKLHEILRQPATGTASDWLLERLGSAGAKQA